MHAPRVSEFVNCLLKCAGLSHVALFQGTQHLAALESLARERKREGEREGWREGVREGGREKERKRERISTETPQCESQDAADAASLNPKPCTFCKLA